MKRCSIIWHVLFNFENYVENWVSLTTFQFCKNYPADLSALKAETLLISVSYSGMMFL